MVVMILVVASVEKQRLRLGDTAGGSRGKHVTLVADSPT